jgi:hypothetical protein
VQRVTLLPTLQLCVYLLPVALALALVMDALD